jgi:hypothetical protein
VASSAGLGAQRPTPLDARTALTEGLAARIGRRSSVFQLPQHLACGGVALVGKPPQFVEVALLASELDELVACAGTSKKPTVFRLAPTTDEGSDREAVRPILAYRPTTGQPSQVDAPQSRRLNLVHDLHAC